MCAGSTFCRPGRLIRAPHTPGVSHVRTRSEATPAEWQKKSQEICDACINKQFKQSYTSSPRPRWLRFARWGWRWCSTEHVWRAWWWPPSYSAEPQRNDAPSTTPGPSRSRPDTQAYNSVSISVYSKTQYTLTEVHLIYLSYILPDCVWPPVSSSRTAGHYPRPSPIHPCDLIAPGQSNSNVRFSQWCVVLFQMIEPLSPHLLIHVSKSRSWFIFKITLIDQDDYTYHL